MGGQVGSVRPNASIDDCNNADVIVAVKRLQHPWIDNIKRSKKPWIWDLVDMYPQPACYKWSRKYAINWIRDRILEHNPDGLIYANKRMAQDVGLPGVVIYHHARELKTINLKVKIRIAGYDGRVDYLGRWFDVLKKECFKRGILFSTELPANELDLVFAFRDKPWNGYCQTHWKSNIKLANVHAAGVPFIGNKESSYVETLAGLEIFIKKPTEIGDAIDSVLSLNTRKNIRENFLKNVITVEQVGQQLKDYCEKISNGKKNA